MRVCLRERMKGKDVQKSNKKSLFRLPVIESLHDMIVLTFTKLSIYNNNNNNNKNNINNNNTTTITKKKSLTMGSDFS